MEVTGLEHVSGLQLDEWLAGELDAQASARLEQHFQACSTCARRRDERVRAGEGFLSAAPSFDVHARIAQRRKRRERALAAGAWVGAVCAAASLFVAVLPAMRTPIAAPPPALDAARGKGAAHVGYYVKRGAQVARGDAHTTVRAGDLLRFTYSVDHAAYLALFDLDQRGGRVYFPAGAERAAEVPPGSDMALEFSVELDDAPGDEQVYAVFCPQAFELAPVQHALQAAGRIPALADCAIDQLVLHKESTP